MRKLLTAFVLLLCTLSAFSQLRTLTGQVIDSKGQPVPYATIKTKDRNLSAVADEKGNFTIKDVNEGERLIISSASFANEEIKVGRQSTVVITLQAQDDLRAVVVTTSLGIKRQAKELGYAATTINNKTLTQAKSVNVQQALNGKVSGVSVATVNSGVFEDAKINIRGIRSLTGNNQPMLLVDGSPTPLGFLSSIPPDDIQDLTVLKSSASAAIYGPDAVNGVIVVTTKRGSSNNRVSVAVSSSVQAARVAYFPKLQKEFGAGAGETLDQYGNYLYVPYENQQYGPAFDGSIRDIGVHLEDGSIQSGPYSNLHYKDKVKFWNTGLTMQNSISVTGQDFYFSFEDAKIKGLMPHDENRRSSLRFSGGKKMGNFSVNYGLNYVLQNYDVVNEAGLANLFPAYNGSIFFLVMQTPSNIPLLQYKDWRNNKFAQFSNYYNEFAVNPYWVIGNVRQKGREDDLIGNVDLGYQFLPWLKGNVRVSSSLAFTNLQNNIAPVTVTDWADANRNPTQYTNRPGSVATGQTYNSRINLDYFLSGDRTISKDFDVKYIAGGMLRDNRGKSVGINGNNLFIPYLYTVNVRSGEPGVGNNAFTESRLLSAYGSVNLSFRDWAFLELTGRNDWDSRLSKENRSFFYPGASVSFMLSDVIPALKNSRLINYAKLRAAYSKSGNVNLGVYALAPTYSQQLGFPYGNNGGFSADGTIPGANLKPEFIQTKEVGFDLEFLKGRIGIGASYFDQHCDNQVLNVSQSISSGYTTAILNAASFRNYGVEMDLGLSPLIAVGRGRIDLKINATYNNNEVLSTFGNAPVVIGGNSGFISNSIDAPTANNIAIVGHPAFTFQLTDYARDPQGRIIIDPQTGMPGPASELITKGRTIPLWVIGTTPSYTLGNFSVSMTWDYKGGHDFYSGLGADMDFAGISKRSAEYGRRRFIIPNSSYWDGSKYVPNTSIQVQSGNYEFWANGTTNTSIATNYFASAAAIRLREVNISYNLPTKWTGNGKVIKRITVSAIGKNLLLFVPKSNQWGDPEFNYTSAGNTFGLSSSFQSPASRLFGGAITVQF